MPCVYQHTINNNTRLGLWHITEPEAFFTRRVPVKRDVSHPHKRLQHLAGRYLLTELFTDFPLEEILVADTRKPFLPDEQYHFSISHCGNYAAAIASAHCRVGIDIEIPAARILQLAPKFTSAGEQLLLEQCGSMNHLIQTATLLWSAKEAMFKWFGNGGIDFKQHLQVLRTDGNEEGGTLHCRFTKGAPVELTLYYRMQPNLLMSWVCT